MAWNPETDSWGPGEIPVGDASVLSDTKDTAVPAKGGAPSVLPQQPSPDFMSDINTRADKLQHDLVGPAKKAQQNQSYADRQLADNAEKHQRDLQESWNYERAIARDPALRPWNADQERAARTRGPMEQFGSVGVIFAMAASAFTRTPMTSALNAGAAAMTAIQQGDEKAYESAYKAWKDNSDLALRRFDMEHRLYEDANQLLTTDMNLWKTKTLQIAAQFDDQKTIAMLNNGMYPEVLKAKEAAAKAAIEVRKEQQGFEEYEAKRTMISDGIKALRQAHPDWKDDNKSPEQAVAEAKVYRDVVTAMKGGETIQERLDRALAVEGQRNYRAELSANTRRDLAQLSDATRREIAENMEAGRENRAELSVQARSEIARMGAESRTEIQAMLEQGRNTRSERTEEGRNTRAAAAEAGKASRAQLSADTRMAVAKMSDDTKLQIANLAEGGRNERSYLSAEARTEIAGMNADARRELMEFVEAKKDARAKDAEAGRNARNAQKIVGGSKPTLAGEKAAVIEKYKDEFREKYGREPGAAELKQIVDDATAGEAKSVTMLDAREIERRAKEYAADGMDQTAARDRAKKEVMNKTGLTDEQAEFMARQYMTGDKSVFQNLGRGLQGAADLRFLRQKVVELAEKEHISPQELSTRMAEFAGLAAAERTLGVRTANVEMFNNEALNMMDVVQKASRDLPRTQFPSVNKALQAYQYNTGDTRVVALGAAINGLVNTYAKAINGGAAGTVSDKDHAREILGKADTMEQIEAKLDVLRNELQAARKAPGQVRQELRDLSGGGSTIERGRVPSSEVKSPPVSLLKEGTITTFSNGSKWTLQNGKPVQVGQ